MKNLSLFTILFALVFVVSCGQQAGDGANGDGEKTEMSEKKKQDSSSDNMGDKQMNVIKKMKKQMEGKSYAMSEEQLSQVDSLIEVVGLSKEQSSEDFKASLKELRMKMYNHVFNEEQKKVYEDSGLEVPK
ncbi:MAG: hypothetical protein R3275_13645 [Saprospiraceae bacterium]|nr:hypothetical protein [Saprospiraceae bacterium]